MNRRQLLILVVVGVLIGLLGAFVYQRRDASWQPSSGSASGGKVLPAFPLNDVAHIVVKSAGGEVNLLKVNDIWSVQERGGYRANFDEISELIRKAWELKVVQEVKVGSSQFARLELIEPGQGANSGTLVEFKDKAGARIAAVLLGKKHMKDGGEAAGLGGGGGFPAGRYVMALAEPKRVVLISDPMTDVEPKPEHWLNKDFLKIEKAKSIAVAGTSAAINWKITRVSETADWILTDPKPGEELDKNKASSAAGSWSSPSFHDVMAADAKPETTGLDQPTVATLETFDGFIYTLKIGKPAGDNYPVAPSITANLIAERPAKPDEKPEDKTRLDQEFAATKKQLEARLASEKMLEGRVYLVPKYSVESLLKERTQLFVEKTPAPAAGASPGAAPEGVSVTTPPVSAPPLEPVPEGSPSASPAPETAASPAKKSAVPKKK